MFVFYFHEPEPLNLKGEFFVPQTIIIEYRMIAAKFG